MLKLIKDERVINPFKETSEHLIAIHTGEVMDPEISACLDSVHSIGEALARTYIKEAIEDGTKPITDTISRTGLYTFTNRTPVKLGSTKSSSAKNTALVTQMFMSLQARPEADMLEFFSHENQRDPPSLSENGKIYQSAKSDLIDCLPGMVKPGKNPAARKATVLLDMPAIIHMVSPKKASTFVEYSPKHLVPFIDAQVRETAVTSVHGVWDVYKEQRLKNQTGQFSKGSSQRRNVVGDSIPIPHGKDWTKSLNDPDTKNEMFPYLSKKITHIVAETPGRKKYSFTSTLNESVICSDKDVNIESLQNCSHEEADTRIFIHLQFAARQGHHIAKIRTVDTDIVVLAIGLFFQLQLTELWVGFGTGKTYRDIPNHTVCQLLGPLKCEALPTFHALTGCDYTSFFRGKGKKTAWKAWEELPEMTEIFRAIEDSNPHEFTIDSPEMKAPEKCVCYLYAKDKGYNNVNLCRQKMFTVGLKQLESIPPTLNALYQHVRRSLLICAFQWSFCLDNSPPSPDPNEWGWEWNPRTRSWVPYWTDLPDVSEGCSLLIHCGCKVSCRGNCKCFRANIRCTALCECEGNCINNDRFGDLD